jgi:hypothetical protein
MISLTSYAMNMPGHGGKTVYCSSVEITCASTVTTTFAPDGSLWRLWSVQDSLYFDKSDDKGERFGLAKRVNIAPEKISSRGENRPKIAIDKFNGIYLSWSHPLEKRFSATIRFTYSADGENFLPVKTVNNDGLNTGHSFNEMLIDELGLVSLIWLDRRQAIYAKSRGESYNGSAIYLAQGKVEGNGITFNNKKLVDTTCVCCRLDLTKNANNKLALAWRHIFNDNIRDHALLTLNGKSSIHHRFSRDMWKIDGCPHQGPSLSIDKTNRYHLTWFNQGAQGKGIFYGYSDDLGTNMSAKKRLGDNSKQAAHPDIYAFNNRVDIVWLEFDGQTHQLWHKVSHNNGETFQKAKMLSNSSTKTDRPFIIAQGDERLVSWQIVSNEHRLIEL